MNHEVLKNVIFDQHDVIKNAEIVDRRYTFEKEANYVLTGLRRAGKSTIMHKAARNLVEAGVSWDQIISINFEDERLAEFTTADFNDIVMLASEMSSAKPYFFFDEIHNLHFINNVDIVNNNLFNVIIQFWNRLMDNTVHSHFIKKF